MRESRVAADNNTGQRSLSNKQQSWPGLGKFIKATKKRAGRKLQPRPRLLCVAAFCPTVKMRRSEHHWICDWTEISIHWSRSFLFFTSLSAHFHLENACWSDNAESRVSGPGQPSLVHGYILSLLSQSGRIENLYLRYCKLCTRLSLALWIVCQMSRQAGNSLRIFSRVVFPVTKPSPPFTNQPPNPWRAFNNCVKRFQFYISILI